MNSVTLNYHNVINGYGKCRCRCFFTFIQGKIKYIKVNKRTKICLYVT